jgi:hypothetical protein
MPFVSCTTYNAGQTAQDAATTAAITAATAAPAICPAVVTCITSRPTGAPAVAGDLVIGADGQKHALPAAGALSCPAVVACITAQPTTTPAVAGTTAVLGSDGSFHTLPLSSGGIVIQDEGAALGTATTTNFVGAGVTTTLTAGVATVTIPSSTLAIQDEGATLTAAPTSINFVGAGVTSTNVAGAVTVTIPTNTHATVLATCPVTGPTVAPTVEGHYYYTSPNGEKWIWVYGDPAPYVHGKLYGQTNTYPDIGATGAPVLTTLLSYTCPRAGRIYAVAAAAATCAATASTPLGGTTAIGSNLSAGVNKNGVFTGSATDAGRAYVLGDNIGASGSQVFDVVAGDVLNFIIYTGFTSSTQFISTSLQYQN